MPGFMKGALTALGVLIAAGTFMPGKANANLYGYATDYCREYTRTIHIGGRMEQAYGRACLQPNGDWMIVGEGLANDIPPQASDVTYVIRDNTRYITPPRVVYYSSPRVVYRSQPAFVWHHNSRSKSSHYVRHDNRRNWSGHKNHHRPANHRGRGQGHGRY
ncbi:MAG: hypothetical protein WC989_03785 [Micavibrio sp.]